MQTFSAYVSRVRTLTHDVRENRIDVVRFLLEHDCNPLDLWMDDDPIEIACDRGYTEMEQLLTHTLDTKFNASPQGEPVALALREHDLKRMRELLDAQPALVGKGDRRTPPAPTKDSSTTSSSNDRSSRPARDTAASPTTRSPRVVFIRSGLATTLALMSPRQIASIRVGDLATAYSFSNYETLLADLWSDVDAWRQRR